jgi:hypothetical protein
VTPLERPLFESEDQCVSECKNLLGAGLWLARVEVEQSCIELSLHCVNFTSEPWS